jgi:RNA polymerase sigma-70 factor (ECF subfamily)
MLGISAGTSKSNLHKARQKLKLMILKADEPRADNGGGNFNYSPVVAINAANVNGVFFKNGIR